MAANNAKCTCGRILVTVSDQAINNNNNKDVCLECSEQTSSSSNTPSPEKETSSDTQTLERESPSKGRRKTWEKAPFLVNNFEHRHAAQQRILEMQQKQIKEQQRLIEELQYLQKQQLLQQELLRQEQVKVQLGSNTSGTDSIQNTLTHLQNHIQNLQEQILQHGVGNSSKDSGSPSVETAVVARDLEDEEESTAYNGPGSSAVNGQLKLNLDDVLTKVEEVKTATSGKSVNCERTHRLVVNT